MAGKYFIHDFLKEDFPISQEYGVNVEYYKNFTNGGLQHGHEGVDFKTPNGTPLYAPFDGIIVRDGISAKDYGRFLVIWDPIQLCALWFCHLMDTAVQINQKVKAGDLLGHTNNTGNTTGPHCHVNFVETDGNGIRLNMNNGEEGFLNLMDPNLVDYPWKPCAADMQTCLVQPHYKVGDEIIVSSPIPTGQAPASISFDYGRIAPGTPAKVLDIIQSSGEPYYHIDQTYIGGGTGYASVQAVDAVAFTPSLPTAPATAQPTPSPSYLGNQGAVAGNSQVEDAGVSPVLPLSSLPTAASLASVDTPQDPQKKIEALQVQNNDLLAKNAEMGEKYRTDLEHYMGILALGFTKPEDIMKALEEVRNENTGLKKQLVEVLKRNKAYHLDMAAKEEEDATAIETGMKYESLYKQARGELVQVAKYLKTKPSMISIIQIAENLRTAYERAIHQLGKNQTQQSVAQGLAVAEKTLEEVPQIVTRSSVLERLITFGK